MVSNLVIKKFSEGDEKAFREVYYNHYNYVFHIANRMLKQRDKAEDVIADVFTAIWLHRHIFEKTVDLKAYISASVRNKCFNIKRDERRRENLKQKMTEAIYKETVVDPYKSFKILKEEVAIQLIYNIAENLPKGFKEVFFLFYSDGESIIAIADHLNVTRQAVYYRQLIAINFIKDRIRMLPYKIIRENYV